MDNRSWEAGAAGVAPAVPAVPSVGYPTNGDPVTSSPATLPGAWWFHQIGEEIRAVLAAAGVEPNASNTTQLIESIKRLIDEKSGNYALDTGAANAYVVELSPAIVAYANGLTMRVKVVNTNTEATTLNAGGGVVPLVNNVGGALVAGDLTAGGVYEATYIASAGKFYITNLVLSQAAAVGGGISQAQGDVRYAALAGLVTQLFSVAPATAAGHAVQKSQMDAVQAAGLGASQTWQNMTASRAKGVTYTNTTGKPIVVSALFLIGSGTDSVSIYVDSIYVHAQSYNSSGSGGCTAVAVIPPGSTYHVESTVGTLYLWSELR